MVNDSIRARNESSMTAARAAAQVTVAIRGEPRGLLEAAE